MKKLISIVAVFLIILILFSCSTMTMQQRADNELGNLSLLSDEALLEKYYDTERRQDKWEQELKEARGDIFTRALMEGKIDIEIKKKTKIRMELRKRNINP